MLVVWNVCLMDIPGIKKFSIFFQEIDHVGYVRQAFEAAPLNYIIEILHNDILRESDVSGKNSFISYGFVYIIKIFKESAFFISVFLYDEFWLSGCCYDDSFPNVRFHFKPFFVLMKKLLTMI